MARPRKTAEMEIVFNNLKNATYEELVAVKTECEKLIGKAKEAQIVATENQIKALQSKLAELKK